MARKRTVESYLKSAKELQKYAPALRKYQRRKTLNRWEKSAITRKQNAIGDVQNLHALTKRQVKSLKSKDAIIRGGVRAVRLRETSPSATVRIIKGEIVVKDQEKIFEYIAVPANQDAINAAAKELFDRYNNITVWLWTINGRISAGANSYTQWFNEFGTKLNEYSKIKLWVTGLAYTKFK